MTDSIPKPDQSAAQSRLCFVIMPFSSTDSCTKGEWTDIFDNYLKPAIEAAGLNYVCRRSAATRGNIVAAIMESLRDAYVVIADLTDQNPNVFYELGVRHTLKNRTILIAQDKKFIPFDLRPYAYHVYKWKTERGQQELTAKLRELLTDVDQSPDRPDNPVSDFLRTRAPTQEALSPPLTKTPTITPEEAPFAQALAGPESEGVDPLALGRAIGKNRDHVALRTVVRLTRAFFQNEWPSRIEALNLKASGGTSVRQDEIYQHCLPYIEKFATDIEGVEQFGLALVEAEYTDGLVGMLRIIEDWISLSEKIWGGRSLKAVRGAPGLLALRVLANWAAKAADNMSLDVLGTLLTQPLGTTEGTGQVATLPLVERGGLFHPEALLDHADLAVQYLKEASWTNDGLRQMFAAQQDYLDGLSRFLFVAALIYDARHPDEPWPLYPGFKLIEGSSQSLRTFVSKLSSSPEGLASLAKMANEDVETFRSNWPARAKRLNEAKLGGRMDLFSTWRDIPERL